jgi:hypothetical protein
LQVVVVAVETIMVVMVFWAVAVRVVLCLAQAQEQVQQIIGEFQVVLPYQLLELLEIQVAAQVVVQEMEQVLQVFQVAAADTHLQVMVAQVVRE